MGILRAATDSFPGRGRAPAVRLLSVRQRQRKLGLRHESFTTHPPLPLRWQGIAGQNVDAGLVASALAGTPAAAAGSPYLDFGARLYDPRSASWLARTRWPRSTMESVRMPIVREIR